MGQPWINCAQFSLNIRFRIPPADHEFAEMLPRLLEFKSSVQLANRLSLGSLLAILGWRT